MLILNLEREGGREGGRKGGRKGGREEERKGGRTTGSEGGREGGKEGGRDKGGVKLQVHVHGTCMCIQVGQSKEWNMLFQASQLPSALHACI